MNPLTQKAANALRAAVEAASICPATFNMSSYAQHSEYDTVLCIGGNMLVLEGWMPDWHSPVARTAWYFSKDGEVRDVVTLLQDLFGFSCLDIGTEQLWIFYITYWPLDLAGRYYAGDTIAAAREAVERFIAERGIEPHPEKETIIHDQYATRS
jgi:hypothetical protein